MSRIGRRFTFTHPAAVGEGSPQDLNVTVLGMPPGPPPSPANSPALQALLRQSPAAYAALAPALPEMRRLEARLFTWLRADPAHAADFARDPLAAFQAACQPSAELVAALGRARAEAAKVAAKP